jgi:Flp pilus assembly pilin Flp
MKSPQLHGNAGATTMEYVLILIVVGLTILFIASHLGGTLRARYGAVKATTNVTLIRPGTHVEVDDQGLTGTAKNVPD